MHISMHNYIYDIGDMSMPWIYGVKREKEKEIYIYDERERDIERRERYRGEHIYEHIWQAFEKEAQ